VTGSPVSEFGGPSPQPTIGTSRLEAFSDGVMAVIITITALSLKAPLSGRSSIEPPTARTARLHPQLHVRRDLLEQPPPLAPRHAPHQCRVMWANLHLLFWLSLIPVVTEWVGSFYGTTGPPPPLALWPSVRSGFSILVAAIIRANGGTQRWSSLGPNLKGNISVALYACGVGWPSSALTWRTPCMPRWRSSGLSGSALRAVGSVTV